MKIDFWGHKRKKNGLRKDTAIELSCYCVIRDGGMGKMPGKSGKEAFSWGKRGRLGWLRRKLLQETARNSKRPFPKRPDFFKIDISNRL